MSAKSNLENISILLVETKHAGNVGAAARAMKNMGLSRLKLVRPPDLQGRQALQFAVRAQDLVRQASTHASFESALEQEQVVVGTTSVRGRRPRTQLHELRSLAPLLVEYARSQRVCIVFGPERTGLTEEQLSRCQYLLTIPADERLPTLNVAQAVLLVANALFEAAGAAPEELTQPELATQSDREEMFAHLERTLIEIGFLSQSNPEHIMRSIRRFLGKAELTPRDIQILRGICSQMEWFIREGHRLEPDRIKKP